MADALQDRYDDESLSCVIQPIPLVFPWTVTPKAADFPAGSQHRTIPAIEWVVEMFEDDARVRFVSYLSMKLGANLTDKINALPGSYLSFVYRNVFTNLREENPDVLPFRIDHQLATPAHAIPAAWVAYHMAGMLKEDFEGLTDNESMYRFKLLTDLENVLATFLNYMLAANPTVKKDTHLIICNTRTQGSRQTVYVDRDLLDKYLKAGGTIKALCDNWVNNETNPTP